MESPKDGERKEGAGQASEVQREPPSLGRQYKDSNFEYWMKENKNIQNTQKSIKANINEPVVSEILNETMPDDGYMLLTEDKYEEILRDKGIECNETPFNELIQNLSKLEHGCGLELLLGKLPSGKYDFKWRPTLSNTVIYRAKGSTISNLTGTLSSAIYFKPGSKPKSKSKCPINKIQIHDVTTGKKGLSPFQNIFSQLENESYPTVIEYNNNNDAIRKLLVYVPDGISVHQLFDVYEEQLGRMQRKFYEVVYKGRQKTTAERENLIQSIIEKHMKKYRQGGHSKTALSQWVSTDLLKNHNIDLAPNSIRRHYLKDIPTYPKGTIGDNHE